MIRVKRGKQTHHQKLAPPSDGLPFKITLRKEFRVTTASVNRTAQGNATVLWNHTEGASLLQRLGITDHDWRFNICANFEPDYALALLEEVTGRYPLQSCPHISLETLYFLGQQGHQPSALATPAEQVSHQGENSDDIGAEVAALSSMALSPVAGLV